MEVCRTEAERASGSGPRSGRLWRLCPSDSMALRQYWRAQQRFSHAANMSDQSEPNRRKTPPQPDSDRPRQPAQPPATESPTPAGSAAPVDLPATLQATGEGQSNLQLPKIISFETLAKCGDEVWIEHHGRLYRLRETRQGKLILTK